MSVPVQTVGTAGAQRVPLSPSWDTHGAPAPAGNAADAAAAVYHRGCSQQLPMGFLHRDSPGSHPGKAAPAPPPGPARGTTGIGVAPCPRRGPGIAGGWVGTPRAAGPERGPRAGMRCPRRDKTRLLSGDGCGARPAPSIVGGSWAGEHPPGIPAGLGVREPALGAGPRASESRARVAPGPGRPLPAGTAFSGRACLGSSGDAGLAGTARLGTAQPRRARGPRHPNTHRGEPPAPHRAPLPHPAPR